MYCRPAWACTGLRRAGLSVVEMRVPIDTTSYYSLAMENTHCSHPELIVPHLQIPVFARKWCGGGVVG